MLIWEETAAFSFLCIHLYSDVDGNGKDKK